MTILLFGLFIIKHFICDFLLQRSYQYRNKWRYGHPGGLLHAAIHMLGTWLILVWISVPLAVAAAIIDGILHYHIDWAKAQINHRFNLSHNTDGFWILFGLDQMLHTLTYLFIVWMVIDPAALATIHRFLQNQ